MLIQNEKKIKLKKMDIKAQYILQRKFQLYQTPRFYEDTSGKDKKSKSIKKITKKLSIFDQIIKTNLHVPGVGKYTINSKQSSNEVKKQNNKQLFQKHEPRGSYLDSLVKRSLSIPSVGKYDIVTKPKVKKHSKDIKEEIKGFRPTVFDATNLDNLDIAPGNYTLNKKLNTSPKYSISPEHKRKLSLPKLPSPAQYNPVPSSYSTFEKKSIQFRQSQSGSKIPTFGVKRSSKLLVKSPGPIYNLISDWGKQEPYKAKFNIYKSISVPKGQSVYNAPQTAR